MTANIMIEAVNRIEFGVADVWILLQVAPKTVQRQNIFCRVTRIAIGKNAVFSEWNLWKKHWQFVSALQSSKVSKSTCFLPAKHQKWANVRERHQQRNIPDTIFTEMSSGSDSWYTPRGRKITRNRARIFRWWALSGHGGFRFAWKIWQLMCSSKNWKRKNIHLRKNKHLVHLTQINYNYIFFDFQLFYQQDHDSNTLLTGCRLNAIRLDWLHRFPKKKLMELRFRHFAKLLIHF